MSSRKAAREKEIGEEKRKKCQGRGMDPDWTVLTGDGESVSDDAEGGPSEAECAHGVIAPGDPTGRGGAVSPVSDWGQRVVLRGLSFGFRGVDGERDGGVDGDLVSGHWGRGRGEWTVWLLLDNLRGVCHVRVAVRKSRNPSRESTNCRMRLARLVVVARRREWLRSEHVRQREGRRRGGGRGGGFKRRASCE